MTKYIFLSIFISAFSFYSKGQYLNKWKDEASATWVNIVEYEPTARENPSMHLSLIEILLPDIQKGKIKFFKSPDLEHEVK